MVSFECNAIYVEDVEDRSNIPKGCNAMYVRDVEDVKDRSNTPKACNAMYVKDNLRHLQHASTYIGFNWMKSPKSQLSKTFFGLKIH